MSAARIRPRPAARLSGDGWPPAQRRRRPGFARPGALRHVGARTSMALDARFADPPSSAGTIAGADGEAMIRGWVILALSLGYVGLLFALAYYGDRLAKARGR